MPPGPWWLIAFRFLLGIGIGADYPISATLVSEFASKHGRGKLSTSLGAMWFVGAVAAYLVGLLVLPLGDLAWRAMLLVGAVFALVVFVLRVKLPESSRWLVAHGRIEEARDVVEQITGVRPSADAVTARATTNVEASARRVSPASLFTGRQLRRTFFVCGF